MKIQVIDAKDNLHISSGTAGYVDFKVDPVGMKLPIKCWIHTHPFGSAYFSGTDIRTVSIWEPLMHNAVVLGGRGHYGIWDNKNPKQLNIYRKYTFERTQRWGEGTYGYDENEAPACMGVIPPRLRRKAKNYQTRTIFWIHVGFRNF